MDFVKKQHAIPSITASQQDEKFDIAASIPAKASE